MVNIYIICPVRNGMPEKVYKYAEDLEKKGYTVYLPPRDCNQEDPTGWDICETHLRKMEEATDVHIFWDKDSFGSHFDLGR